MINLRAFVLVMSIIALRHSAMNTQWVALDWPGLQRDSEGYYPDTLITSCVFFCVVAKFLAVLAALHADQAGRYAAWRRYTSMRQGLEWLWIVVQAIAIPTSFVAKQIIQVEQSGAIPSLMVMAWFIPSLIFLCVLEYCTVELEQDMTNPIAQRATARSPVAGRTSVQFPVAGRTSVQSATTNQKHRDTTHEMWLDRMRLGVVGQMLTCIVPIWIVLASNDLLACFAPALSEAVRLLLALMVLASLCLSLAPLWMSSMMDGRPVDAQHPLQQRVDELCSRMRLRSPRVRHVGQGNNWYGAAVVGWTPLNRQLWIGSALQKVLSPAQLDMVVLHELAHIQRGHCWWRTLPMVTAGAALVTLAVNSSNEDMSVSGQGAVLVLAAALAWVLGWISRRCELDADRVACRQATQCCGWADGRPERAATELASALAILKDPQQPLTASHWLHPSLKSRIDFLPWSALRKDS